MKKKEMQEIVLINKNKYKILAKKRKHIINTILKVQ